jgi:hypothetical protein
MIKNRVRKTALLLAWTGRTPYQNGHVTWNWQGKAVQVRFDLLQEGPTPLTVAHEVELGCKCVN